MSRIFISAAHKSSGKTTISIGLCAALTKLNKHVQPFKKGPDYIDPMWLGAAAQRPCHNLDFYTMQDQEILESFARYQDGVDLNLIEGNKGLYDGLDLDGSNSNAALAKLLNAPVILVIDARGMTRGIAPLILGYQAFDKEVNIAGVILNQLGGSRHESKLRQVIEHYTEVPVVGAVHRDESMTIDERHLGLMPANETREATAQIELLSKQIGAQVDLEKIQTIAHSAPALALPALNRIDNGKRSEQVTIGIARDAAFGFYYPDDIEAFAACNAELVNIDLMNDDNLPAIDGLFIGGGFPEIQMAQLENNKQMRSAIYDAIHNGLPCYAECGGLMYLARSITWNNQTHEMVGIIPGDIQMLEKPQGRGYIRISASEYSPWPAGETVKSEIYAHEFHYSSLNNVPADTIYAYNVHRGTGIDGKHDGIVFKNMLACYAHLRNTHQSPWVKGFVDFVRKHKQAQ
jgi:cobyrinic acid a,c-diamide synthase